MVEICWTILRGVGNSSRIAKLSEISGIPISRWMPVLCKLHAHVSYKLAAGLFNHPSFALNSAYFGPKGGSKLSFSIHHWATTYYP